MIIKSSYIVNDGAFSPSFSIQNCFTKTTRPSIFGLCQVCQKDLDRNQKLGNFQNKTFK